MLYIAIPFFYYIMMIDVIFKRIKDFFFNTKKQPIKNVGNLIKKKIVKKKASVKKIDDNVKNPREVKKLQKKSNKIVINKKQEDKLVVDKAKKVKKQLVKKRIAKKKVESPKCKKIISKKVPRKKKANEVFVAEITHYFARINVAVLKMISLVINIGDEILIKGNASNFKQEITSMQVESVDVKSAKKGQLVGLQVVKSVKVGDQVFLLEKH